MEALLKQFPPRDFALLGLILAAPLIGAFVNGVFGKRLGKDAVRTMALAVIGAAFVGSVATFFAVLAAGHGEEPARLSWTAWDWFSVTGPMRRDVRLSVAFSVDALSATMMLVVTGVGFLIHLYSTAYMAHDRGFHRFFAYLSLFIFMMLVLILGDNLIVLFVGWEGVGLCSYLLIGYWFEDEKKAAAGKKAFIANRIGDFGLLLAMAMCIYYAGTLSFSELSTRASGMAAMVQVWPIGDLSQSALPGPLADLLTPAEPWRVSIATLVALAMFVGATGKSAQVPLYVWLPDAMAGPTPVSALIHAATMVTAGVYLVARCSFIFIQSPAAMAIVAGTGAFTAILAATIAFAQTDLKKVLAYSTVSQLGFMFIGVGSGAFEAGFFHVITHAFFKGCLFLCAGSVIHAMHERVHDEAASQDMRNMGGLRKYLPITHATFLVSCLAIAGCPPLSGFWSKDEILFKAFTSHVPASGSAWVPPAWYGKAIFAVGLIAAVCTAFYMFRAYFLTFWGEFRGWKIVAGWRPPKNKRHHHHHDVEVGRRISGPVPHESPWQMTLPLVILAALALGGGFLMAEPIHVAPLAHLWEPVFGLAHKVVAAAPGAEGLLLPLMGAGTAAFLVGGAGAYYVYVVRGGEPARAFVEAFPGLHRVVENKWYVDELYDATVVGMIDAMGDTAAQFDRWVIDGIIAKLTAGVTRVAGAALAAAHTGRVQVYAAAMVVGTAVSGWFLFSPHAQAEVDDSTLRQSGDVSFKAAPGHGYRYRWTIAGDSATPGEFSDDPTFKLALGNCETKTVQLAVQNMLGRTAEKTFTTCREMFLGCCRAEGTGPLPIPNASGLPQLPGLAPGKYDAEAIKDILRGRRPKTIDEKKAEEQEKGGAP
jgi:NADH-quinone oxidoreductase subunit L